MLNNDDIEIGLEGSDGASTYSKVNKIKIPSIILKDYLQKEPIIDLLKIDIEGAKYEVLKDCKSDLGKVKNIFVEYHSFANQEQKLSQIFHILQENGFRYFIKTVMDRESPLINRTNKFNPNMDLQLNIFGYKIK